MVPTCLSCGLYLARADGVTPRRTGGAGVRLAHHACGSCGAEAVYVELGRACGEDAAGYARRRRDALAAVRALEPFGLAAVLVERPPAEAT